MSQIINQFLKDPDAQLDYPIDWSKWLEDRPGDSIAESEWILPDEDPASLEIAGEANDETSTAVWLRGGAPGSTYDVINRITTSSTPPRIDERSIRIVMRN